ncbi:cytochrome b/b6 domain-containing protein [Alteromonas sp. A081]|uniref:cytochrome b/b6 domain-containing protein n=1 Tax=Alteromonas sp. A081 TaxID=3410269 RepID=UPI003B97F020
MIEPITETKPAHNGDNPIQRDVIIWDAVVRLCHWGLVICFITNYFIVEPGRLYHEIAGYSAVLLNAMRVMWGCTRQRTYQDRHNNLGHNDSYACHDKSNNDSNDSYACHDKSNNDSNDSYVCHDKSTSYACHDKNQEKVTGVTSVDALNKPNYASFRGIDLSRQAFKEHLQHLKHRNVPVQTGHNPFGWLMIFAVIGLFVGLGITGFLMEEVDALFGNSTLEWIHSIFADVLYACVLVHIAAVFFVQYRGRVQLLRPMITGLRRNLSRNDKP